MTRNTRQRWLALLGLAMLASLGVGGVFAVRAAVRVLDSLNSDLAVAVIAAAATAFVSVLSIILGKVFESRALVKRELREKKTPVYEDLIKFMFRVIFGVKIGNAPTEKEMLEFMSDFNQRMMVWGSDNVLAAWVRWRRLATDRARVSAHPVELMLLYEQLILTIRRDLGHKNRNLDTGDVLALFINDIGQQSKGTASEQDTTPGGGPCRM